MPKLIIGIIAGIVVVGAVIGGIVIYNNSQQKQTDTGSTQNSSQDTALVDPDGVYTLFSDPSITKKPEDGVKFGNGQTLTWEYDGSKSENDEYATLSYYLYYIQDDGKVQPMTGGNVVGEGGKGTFTVSDSVFNSSAKDRKGFVELIVNWGVKFDGEKYAGSEEKLGMYSVTFDVAE